MPSKKWTDAVDLLLKEFYEGGLTDREMAEIFGTTVFAVAKRRSLLGYCKHKRSKHTRRPKPQKRVYSTFVAMYTKDGRPHMSMLSNDEEAAIRMASSIANKQLLNEICILSPKFSIKRLTGKVVRIT